MGRPSSGTKGVGDTGIRTGVLITLNVVMALFILFPLLYACVSATSVAFMGVEGTFGAFWTSLAVAAAYDVVMIAAAWGLYEFAVEG